MDVMQIFDYHAELMLFWSLELDSLHSKKQKKGEMLFKFTLDLHVLKSLFLKVFVNE